MRFELLLLGLLLTTFSSLQARGARRSIHTETQTTRVDHFLEISIVLAFNSARNDVNLKKKVNTCNFSRDLKIGPHLSQGHVMNLSHVKIF